MSMQFDPSDGLRNTTTYVTTPASETEAREQIQGRLDELKNYINKHGVILEDTGVINAMVAIVAPVPSSETDILLNVKAKYTNTSATTLNLNSLGNVEVLKYGGDSLIAGDIVAGSYLTILFDGTNWRLLNPNNDYNSRLTTAENDITTLEADVSTLETDVGEIETLSIVALINAL